MLIGIFDSGMGGLSVLAEAKLMFPNVDFIYYGDSAYAPYGTKTKEEVINRSLEICDVLIDKGVDGIIVACNTATSAAIVELRKTYHLPIIGMEPALKSALKVYHGGDIVVMATPMTLKEDKFNKLLSNHKKNEMIYKIPTPDLVDLVENAILSGPLVVKALEKYFQEVDLSKIESVVLGCTHFLFLKNSLEEYFGKHVDLIDGHLGTLMELARKMNIPKVDDNKNKNRKIDIINSKGKAYVSRSLELLEKYEASYGD